MIHYTSLTSVASKRIFLDISFIIASSMNKFRDKLRGQTINERNPESIVYIETKQRRKPTQQVLFTEKTEQLESDRQLQHLTIAPDTSSISILTRPLKKMKLSQQQGPKRDFYLDKNPNISGYLATKFKKVLERRQEKVQTKSTYRSSISPEQNKTISFDPLQNESYMTCDTCCRISRKQPIDEGSFLKNAKERILRLMELKLVNEKKDEEVSEHIKSRCLKTEKSKRAIPFSFKMMGIEEKPWDKEWKSSFSLELKRYRSRVINKSRKSQRNKINLQFM